MWEHPATQANVATLRSRGAVVLDPASGRLTGADSGPGRLPEPAAIAAALRSLLRGKGRGADLAGLRVLVSAGGTREALDPVRFLGNRSSGRQGVALAATAAARGAGVRLVTANVELPMPAGVDVVRVGSAEQLRAAMLAAAPEVDLLVMSAAVADFRPAEVADRKIKKRDDGGDGPVVRLVRNPDVLVELVAARAAGGPAGQVIVGFAAETGDDEGSVLEHARRKLAAKGCDLLVVNDVSAGRVFGSDSTEVMLLFPDGEARPLPAGSKEEVADAVWDEVLRLRQGGHRA